MPDELITGAIEKEKLIQDIIKHLDGRKPDISTAWLIAASAFHAHKDRNDVSYTIHLAQTLLSGTDSTKKIIVGILHDLIEDTEWELDDLRRIGFDEHVVRAIDYVSSRPGELYFDFIERCGLSHNEFGTSYLAIDPKIADLTHNMAGSRATALPTDWNNEKMKVYIVARNYLVEIKRGEVLPGTPVSTFMLMRPALYDAELLQKNSSTARTVAAARAGPTPTHAP